MQLPLKMQWFGFDQKHVQSLHLEPGYMEFWSILPYLRETLNPEKNDCCLCSCALLNCDFLEAEHLLWKKRENSCTTRVQSLLLLCSSLHNNVTICFFSFWLSRQKCCLLKKKKRKFSFSLRSLLKVGRLDYLHHIQNKFSDKLLVF